VGPRECRLPRWDYEMKHGTPRTFKGPPIELGIWLGIFAVAVVLRLALFSGIAATDPAEYLERAYALSNGTFSRYMTSYHHFTARFAVTAPTALVVWALGVSQWTAVVWPFVCFTVTLYLTYRLGAKLISPAVGLVAAAFLAVMPVDIRLSTSLQPDNIVTAFMLVCLYLFLCGYEEPDAKRARRLLICAGLALFGAYSAKLVGGLLFPIIGLYALLSGRDWKRVAWVGAGFALLVIPEFLVFRFLFGDWFYRLHAIVAAQGSSPAVAAVASDVFGRLLTAYPRLMLIPGKDFGVLFPGLLIGVAYGFRHWRRTLLPLIWFVVVLGYLNFGTSDLRAITLMTAQGRYLHPVVIPGLILLASLLVDAWHAVPTESWLKKGVRTGMVSACVTAALVSLAFAYVGRRVRLADLIPGEMQLVYGYATAAGHPPIYTDRRSRNAFYVASGFQWATPVHVFPPADTAGGDYLDNFEEGALLVVTWRELYNAGPYRYRSLRNGEREAMQRAIESGRLERVFDAWRQPAPLFYHLASNPLFRRVVSGEVEDELLGLAPNRGAAVFRVTARRDG
jgi:4-amino-4-deoxy-L-arabinose transferase-like glycosyltransferase